MHVGEERSYGTVFASARGGQNKGKMKPNPSLEGPLDSQEERKPIKLWRPRELGRRWMKAPGGQAGTSPRFSLPIPVLDSTPYISPPPHQPSLANIPAMEFTGGDGSSTPAGGEGEGHFHHTAVRGSELGMCFWHLS